MNSCAFRTFDVLHLYQSVLRRLKLWCREYLEEQICGKGVQYLQVKEYRVFYRSGHCRLMPVNLSAWKVINDME